MFFIWMARPNPPSGDPHFRFAVISLVAGQAYPNILAAAIFSHAVADRKDKRFNGLCCLLEKQEGHAMGPCQRASTIRKG
jgi:hypothetical protein